MEDDKPLNEDQVLASISWAKDMIDSGQLDAAIINLEKVKKILQGKADKVMKLITPAKDWKSPIVIEEDKKEYTLALLQDIAKKLNMVINYDTTTGKLYLDLPRNFIQKAVDSVVRAVKKIFTKQDNYRILFTMDLPESRQNELVEGFYILYCNDVEALRIRASSGQRGHQFRGNFWEVGYSPIPPSSEIIGTYKYSTNWYKPGDVSACGSRFYLIKPDPIYNKYDKTRKKKRTEVGGHFDENNQRSPGSAGCAVSLPRKTEEEKGWNDWNKAMDEINGLGIDWIYMDVIYK